MEKPRDPVIIIASEFERAALRALTALRQADFEAQKAACLRWAAAVREIVAMPEADYSRCLIYVTERAHVPETAWQTIATAMDRLFERTAAGPGNSG